MIKRAKLLPTGEPRALSVPLRLSETERNLLDIASESRGMRLGTYITVVALEQACVDVSALGKKAYDALIDSVTKTVKVEM